MLKITDNKGFHVTFANGWTVSVQFGAGNYCSNRSSGMDFDAFKKPAEPCANAEIAAWDADNSWFEFESGDTVDGWKTPDEVAAFMEMIRVKE